ncbi:BatD family protein [uncultured Muribaculum sp.]|uniref:BatD family protein n=1 Tax=uncultured Muribaculum sp. TaxID=1918613 RepID=UPI002594FC0E|nr:BatD family protein [uncultured Muribaculum sp.]
MKIRLIALLTFITAFAGIVLAETSFTAIPPRSVIAGNKFSVTFRLKNAEGSGIKVPNIDGCTLLYGPATSTMMSYEIINGKQSSSSTVEYIYTYRAVEPGEHTIGEARITVGNKVYTTKPVTFMVLPQDKAASAGTGARVDDISSQTPDKPVSANDVFVRIILNKSRAYEQEAILCTIKLYTKYSISSFLPTTQPAFDGFLIEELNLQPQLNEMEHYNGQNYMTAVLKKCIIFPQKSGKLTINSGKYDITVVQHERFSGFWGGSRPVERDIHVSSNSASINITPLPQPQPSGFTGAVGDYTIDSRLSTSTFRTNEAASLIYTIKGTGNIKSIREPQIDFPTEFEQYTPQTDVSSQVTGSNVSGSMTIDYTFVPQNVGEFTIGADNFVYFNPESGKYVTLTTPRYDIKVSQGAAVSSGASVFNKQAIASKNTDILHIKMGDLNLSKTHQFYFNSWWYIPSYIALAAALTLLILFYRKQVKLNSDLRGRRIANADKVARKRLKMAKQYMAAHDNDHFYEEILRALWGYFSDKLGIPASQLSRENITQQLTEYGVGQELIDSAINLIDDCEMARYSPTRSEEQIEELYKQASNIMNEMERVKRAKI